MGTSATGRDSVRITEFQRRFCAKPLTLFVLAIGLVVTVALVVGTRVHFQNTERRLLTLQDRLSVASLTIVPIERQAELAKVIGLTAASTQPVSTFEHAIRPLMRPAGPFASSSLAKVSGRRVMVIDHLGAASIRNLNGGTVRALFLQSARSQSLVTTRAVGRYWQKLGYLVSARGNGGTFVLAAAQQLPLDDRIRVPASSPDANLNFALYFGRTTQRSALVATNTSSLPLSGVVSRLTVPFGTNVLTLVSSARRPFSRWVQFLPWDVLIVGTLFTVAIAAMTERLVRRRLHAEALARENRQLYGEQREIATTLQHALLPRALPHLPNMQVAARYVPGTEGMDVGGDWYGVVRLDDHRAVFVIGDVSGRGLSAASSMAALRYTTRTCSRLGLSPSEILERAGEEMEIDADEHFATVLAGTLDSADGTVTLASAGHLPPLLITSSGEHSFIELRVGPPLGVRSLHYESTTVEMPPGSTLLAYTDGLIERRDEGLDVGLARLSRAVPRGETSPERLLDALVSQLTVDGNEDDIAVIALQLGSPSPMLPARTQ